MILPHIGKYEFILIHLSDIKNRETQNKPIKIQLVTSNIGKPKF